MRPKHLLRTLTREEVEYELLNDMEDVACFYCRVRFLPDAPAHW